MELNRELLDGIVKTNPGDFAVYRLTEDGLETLYASPGLPDISGMTPEEYGEIAGRDASRIVLESDRPRVAEILGQILRDGRDADADYRIVHKTRGFVWVHAKSRVMGELEGRPVLMTVFLNTSSESEEREFLLNHTIANIYVLDLRTHELLFINDPAARVLGGRNYSGAACHEFVSGLASPCEWCPIPRMKDGVASQDAVFVPKLGRWYRIECRAMNWSGHDAAAVYAVDVTERIERQQSLELDKQNLERIVSSIPGGVGLLHEENGVFSLDYTNDGYYRTHCGSPAYWAQFAGTRVIEGVYEPDRHLLTEEYARVGANEKAQGSATYRVLGEDGRLHWVNIQFRRAYVSEGVPHYYASFTAMDAQKEAEEKLAESQRSLREAVDNSDIQFFTCFPDRRRCEIYTVNSRYAGLPGVWENFPDDFLAAVGASEKAAQTVRDMLARIAAGESEAECTVPFAYRGVRSWERLRLRAAADETGGERKAQGYSINVTAQKEAEERIRKERVRLKTVEGSVVEAFSFNVTQNSQPELQSADGACRVGKLDKAVEREAAAVAPPIGDPGAATRKILLATAQRIPDEKDRALFLRTCGGAGVRRACGEGRFSQTIEYRRMIGDAVRWVSTSVEVLPDPATGDLIAFFYTRDINTEVICRKINEQIASKNYHTVCYYDLHDDRMNVRSSESPEGAAFDGLSYQAALDRAAAAALPPEEADGFRRRFALASIRAELETAPVCTIYYTTRQTNDRLPGRPRRRMKNDIFYLDAHRDVLVYLQSDVTEIFELERENRERLAAALAAAEQASVAKTEFLSRMSHEIRTPMNAIIGLDAIALQESGLSAAMEDHLRKIGISARFLLSLINDILDMSRIESGRMALRSEPFDFEEFVSGINTILYEQCRDSGIDFECVLRGCTEGEYVGDRTKLQQVLVNILGNAVKFTPRGGKIHFMIGQVSRTKEKARLRFEISDTGIGIDPEFMPHLFEPFTQEERGRTSAYGGTGLGLAISRNIVGLMGGEITVHSIKNVGSEFTVEVELGLTQEAIRRRSLAASGMSPLYTLIVDDDVIVCRHTQIVLDEAGLKTEWVDSGEGAVEKVAAQRRAGRDYDLILLDWKMPDMDGIETARQIRRIVGPEVTIIIMTAYDWADIEEKARAAGVDLFMKKPVFASSVTKAFETVFLRREREAEPAPAPEYDFSGRRVLLAEDNEINAEIAQNILGMRGCAVDTAENGVIAIETFMSRPVGYYDAILMDVRMPVMDGLEAARTIRAMRRADAKTIPILAMTANAFQEDVNASLKSGMNAHLAKPIEPQTLYQTLERYLREADKN